MICKFLYIILFSLACSYHLETSVNSDEIYIGDLVKMTLTIKNLDDSYRALFPYISVQNADISIHNEIVNDTMAEYDCQFWSNGKKIFPPQVVYIKNVDGQMLDSIKTKKFTFHINKTILDTATSLKPAKSNFNIVFNNYMAIVISILVLIVSIIIFLFFYNKKVVGNINFTYQKEPLEAAISKIDNLKIKSTTKAGDLQSLSVEMSKIFKEYLKETFYIKSTEMTDSEILLFLKKKFNFDQLYNQYIKLLKKIELMKFSKVNNKNNFSHNDVNVIKKDLIELLFSIQNIKKE